MEMVINAAKSLSIAAALHSEVSEALNVAQQGAIRALGTAVITASPELASVLDRHGLTLDPVNGEGIELEPFNAVMLKRASKWERT